MLRNDVIILQKQTKESNGGVSGMGEKLPLESTLGFKPLQTINMHKNVYKTLQERENPKKHNWAPLKCVSPLEGFVS